MKLTFLPKIYSLFIISEGFTTKVSVISERFTTKVSIISETFSIFLSVITKTRFQDVLSQKIIDLGYTKYINF